MFNCLSCIISHQHFSICLNQTAITITYLATFLLSTGWTGQLPVRSLEVSNVFAEQFEHLTEVQVSVTALSVLLVVRGFLCHSRNRELSRHLATTRIITPWRNSTTLLVLYFQFIYTAMEQTTHYCTGRYSWSSILCY